MNEKTEILLARAAQDTEEKTSVSCAERSFKDETEAKENFARFSEKLLFIEKWNSSSGISTFALFDRSGAAAPRKKAQIGDFMAIKMPMTGKEDWVEITDIENDADEMIVTVQPTHDPTETHAEKTISHFFTADSSNNFCLRRTENRLTMYVIGLDEATNTAQTGGILESARNLATANLGHYLGVQKAEWTTFCRHFLELEAED